MAALTIFPCGIILFAPLMAAAAVLTTSLVFFHPHFSLPIAHYTQMRLVDIASERRRGAIAIAARMVAVWCLRVCTFATD
ncbi:hypothetical protein KCP71_14265 [Salmonella enterica subsp. enterica]|nr:hypothetical protein KCP71_14265 [Salmonella enterica subsp. enterica]